MVPANLKSSLRVDSVANYIKVSEGTKDLSPNNVTDIASPKIHFEPDESISEFESNLRVLFLDLHAGSELMAPDQPQGTRMNERPKKSLIPDSMRILGFLLSRVGQSKTKFRGETTWLV